MGSCMRRFVRVVVCLVMACYWLVPVAPARAAPFTVMNTNDNGSGSLRAAIAAAGNGDTITFGPALNGQTITLASGALAINKNLTITGPGASLLAVDGNHASTVFTVSNGAQVAISGLTVRNGTGLPGSAGTTGSTGGVGGAGGIINNGTLALTNVTVSGNAGGNGGMGGMGGSGVKKLVEVASRISPARLQVHVPVSRPSWIRSG